jgi:hypothetical protein
MRRICPQVVQQIKATGSEGLAAVPQLQRAAGQIAMSLLVGNCI